MESLGLGRKERIAFLRIRAEEVIQNGQQVKVKWNELSNLSIDVD